MIFLNGHTIEPTIFPDKTSQVWKLPEELLNSLRFTIEWKFESESELVHLIQLKTLLDIYPTPCALHLHYLPYGRQDKPVSNIETFGLRPFMKIIDQLCFHHVTCDDPHSELPQKLMNNFFPRYPIDEIRRTSDIVGTTLFFYPDEGAKNKYGKIFCDRPFLYGLKSRTQDLGRIVKYHIIGDARYDSALIVDDICDGGATFVLAADALREIEIKEIFLFVTHGIFSKGIEVLKEAGIKRIFTKNGEVK